jgi:hypothetical protein
LCSAHTSTVVVLDNPYDGSRWIVLDGLCSGRFRPRIPLVIRTQADWGAAQGRLDDQGWGAGRHLRLATSEVAAWFAGRANGAEYDPGHPTWAPASTESFAPVTLDGDNSHPVAYTDDEAWRDGTYAWYDLDDVVVEGSVWRLSSSGTLWVFTRREADRWEATVVPEAKWATTADGWDVGALVEGNRLAQGGR